MSIKLMSQLWDNEDPTLSGTRLNILLCLADHANDAGECWPSIDRLARRARVTPRNVIEHLHALQTTGYLEIRRSPGRHNRYTVNAKPSITREASFTGDATITGEAGFTPTREASFTPTREAGFTPPVKPASPKSSLNHQGEPSYKPPTKKHQQQHARVSRTRPAPKPSANGHGAAAADGLTPEQDLALECLLIAAPQFHNPKSFVLQHPAKTVAHWASYVASPDTEYEIRNPAAFIRAGVTKGEAAPLAASFDKWWYHKLAQRANAGLVFTEQAMEY